MSCGGLSVEKVETFPAWTSKFRSYELPPIPSMAGIAKRTASMVGLLCSGGSRLQMYGVICTSRKNRGRLHPQPRLY